MADSDTSRRNESSTLPIVSAIPLVTSDAGRFTANGVPPIPSDSIPLPGWF